MDHHWFVLLRYKSYIIHLTLISCTHFLFSIISVIILTLVLGSTTVLVLAITSYSCSSYCILTLSLYTHWLLLWGDMPAAYNIQSKYINDCICILVAYVCLMQHVVYILIYTCIYTCIILMIAYTSLRILYIH